MKPVKSRPARKPKNYDGTRLTTYRVSDLLAGALAGISENYDKRPDLILAAWPSIIGPRLAPMTQAVAFTDGVLLVKVKNSTLHSLLSQNDKPQILNTLRALFPKVSIQNIVFRIG